MTTKGCRPANWWGPTPIARVPRFLELPRLQSVAPTIYGSAIDTQPISGARQPSVVASEDDVPRLPTLRELVALAAQRSGYGSAHQRMRQARLIAEELKAVARALVEEHVRAARRQGHSWADVAVGLGISRQAARQMFSGSRSTTGAASTATRRPRDPQVSADFERFKLLTATSRHVLGLAFAEATANSRLSIEPDDILVALAVANGRAGRLMEGAGLHPAALRAAVLEQRLEQPSSDGEWPPRLDGG